MLKSWKEMCDLDISKYVKQRDKADYLPWASCLKLLYSDGLWLFPLSQQETFRFLPSVQKAQVRLLWANGVLEGKEAPSVRINESISKEVL